MMPQMGKGCPQMAAMMGKGGAMMGKGAAPGMPAGAGGKTRPGMMPSLAQMGMMRPQAPNAKGGARPGGPPQAQPAPGAPGGGGSSGPLSASALVVAPPAVQK